MLLLPVLLSLRLPTVGAAQQKCPGYAARNIRQTTNGLAADLHLAGTACNIYGTDLPNLTLTVEYQSGITADGIELLLFTDSE